MQRHDELFMLLTQTIAVIMNHSKSVRVEEPPLDEDRPQDHAIPRGTGPFAVSHLAFDERVVNGARGGVAELARKQGALVLEAALAPLALGPAGPGAHLARPCKGAQPPPAPRGRISVMAPEGAADVMR